MTGRGAVTSGTPAVYYLFYGQWQSTLDQTLQNKLDQLLSDLNDSPYFATAATYSGTTGSVSGRIARQSAIDLNSTQGSALTDAKIQKEIQLAIDNNLFPLNSNAVYFILPDEITALNQLPGNSGAFCSTGNFCGANSNFLYKGVNLTYAAVGNPKNCAVCQLSGNTPNGGVVDGELNWIVHELLEGLTDPQGQQSGWYSSTSSTNTQMGDFCQNNYGSKYTTFSNATANFVGGVNSDGSSRRLSDSDGTCQWKQRPARILYQ